MSRMDSRDLAIERLAKFAYTTPQNNMRAQSIVSVEAPQLPNTSIVPKRELARR